LKGTGDVNSAWIVTGRRPRALHSPTSRVKDTVGQCGFVGVAGTLTDALSPQENDGVPCTLETVTTHGPVGAPE
jgi:hypothetical protein